MDSTGLNSRHHPPIAPSRKKRVAPRPPSQILLSERSEEVNGDHVFKQPHPVMPPKNFFVSSPNLSNNDTKGSKFDAADKKIHPIEEQETEKKPTTRPTSLIVVRKNDAQANADNRKTYAAPSTTVTSDTPKIVAAGANENHSITSSDSAEVKDGPPEPIPRKRTFLGEHNVVRCFEVANKKNIFSKNCSKEKSACSTSTRASTGCASKKCLKNGFN